MSLRRRVTLVFLLVNVVTLGGLAGYILTETGRVRRQFQANQRDIRQRTARLIGTFFTDQMQKELRRALGGGRSFDDAALRRVISDQRYWDEDAFARENLEKAVLVRFDAFRTTLFNPRPRLVFEHGAIDIARVRGAVESARDIATLAGDTIVVGRLDLDTEKTWGFYFRVKEPPSPPVDPARETRNVLFLTIPGVLALLIFIYFFFDKAVLAPVSAMSAAARRISEGHFDERLAHADRTDELGRLARTLNEMMAQLNAYRQRMEGLVDEATERFKKAERHLAIAQRLVAMGQIAAGIAHEINNPLGGIFNALQRLADPNLDPERRKKFFGIADEALGRIRDIVQRVLATAPRAVAPRPTALTTVIEQTIGLIHHRLVKEAVEVRNEIEPGLMVLGNPSDLVQVFLNLFINACDAMIGGGRITVRARVEGKSVEIAVEDTGSGIPEEIQAKIFDLFFTTKPGTQGTGLGLAIVHNIVTAHGGLVSVSSNVGSGTTFFITLPLSDAG